MANIPDVNQSNVDVLPLRSTRKRVQTQFYTSLICKKAKPCSTSIMHLPNEIFLIIFEWLPRKHVLNNVRLVCRRWNSLVRPHWKNIVVTWHVHRSITMRWIYNAHWLKHLTIIDLRDLNNLLIEVSSHCKNLQALEVYGGCLTYRCKRKKPVESSAIKELVLNCKHISLLVFQIRVEPYAFFVDFPKINGECCYVGTITVGQLAELLVYCKKFPRVLNFEINGKYFGEDVSFTTLNQLSAVLTTWKKSDLIALVWDLRNGCIYLENKY